MGKKLACANLNVNAETAIPLDAECVTRRSATSARNWMSNQ